LLPRAQGGGAEWKSGLKVELSGLLRVEDVHPGP
jgi:hypothetical protein